MHNAGVILPATLVQEASTTVFVEEVLNSMLPNKERMAHLLRNGATRIAIEELGDKDEM